MQRDVIVSDFGCGQIEVRLVDNSRATLISHEEALEVAARLVAMVGDDEKFQKYLAEARET